MLLEFTHFIFTTINTHLSLRIQCLEHLQQYCIWLCVSTCGETKWRNDAPIAVHFALQIVKNATVTFHKWKATIHSSLNKKSVLTGPFLSFYFLFFLSFSFIFTISFSLFPFFSFLWIKPKYLSVLTQSPDTGQGRLSWDIQLPSSQSNRLDVPGNFSFSDF